MPIELQKAKTTTGLAFPKQPIKGLRLHWDQDGNIVGLTVEADAKDTAGETTPVAVDIWPKLNATQKAAYQKAILDIGKLVEQEVS